MIRRLLFLLLLVAAMIEAGVALARADAAPPCLVPRNMKPPPGPFLGYTRQETQLAVDLNREMRIVYDKVDGIRGGASQVAAGSGVVLAAPRMERPYYTLPVRHLGEDEMRSLFHGLCQLREGNWEPPKVDHSRLASWWRALKDAAGLPTEDIVT